LDATSLDSIPEMPKSYPEYSQFKELPAWGFYIRHAKNVIFDNVKLTAEKRDYRPAIVVQESENVKLRKMKYKEPGGSKKQTHFYKTK
jgi:pectate lyase